MPDDAFPPVGGPSPFTVDLLTLTEEARARAAVDPFGNPVLSVALAINRRMDEGEIGEAALETLIRALRDEALEARAGRLAAYVGGTDPDEAAASLTALARRLVRPDPDDSPVPLARYRVLLERTRFAAVFTAHPTFALSSEVYRTLAESACGRPSGLCSVSHRPEKPTLQMEYAQATEAIIRGRDALDRLNAALLAAAEPFWPDRWSELVPRPVVLSSWVGYDTDGRTDINWWDTLRLRLDMKRLQLRRVVAQLQPMAGAVALVERVETALAAVDRQIAACPGTGDPDAVGRFADRLIGEREAALVSPEPLLPLFAACIAAAEPGDRRTLCVARAGLVGHGMSLAHTHVRLNAAQLHNAVRLRLHLEEPPADLFRRRVLLATIDEALDRVQPVGVDFGAVLSEQASATRLMMTVAQIVKHIDAVSPIRFLIAETESGYTLLAALWLARLLGVERHIEISPLFETPEALEQGGRIIEEALRSAHYRDYLRTTGRMALQFGYSDSGRYTGQLASTYLIERLRLKVSEALVRHGLTDVELILFDTHGESIGRGAHPGSLADRLKYLSPSMSRQAYAKAGIAVREESAFQGGDGYLLFGTPELALATVACIARHAFAALPASTDPIYGEGDFAADFFGSIGIAMRELVEDPGYGSLLGAFGPAMLDATGSRPSARQTDGMGGPAMIRHPRELRAIPNNAILQQLGWCANTLQGVGTAAARQPELFAEMREKSARFRRALDLAAHGLAHSDIDVLRAVISLLDPGSWLDRAAHARRPGRPQALIHIAEALQTLDLWRQAQAMFRHIQADHLKLRVAWPDAPRMTTRELLLHALRIVVIQRIWLLSTEIPDFSPRHGVSREKLDQLLLRLEVPAALTLLTEVFPDAPDPAVERDYGEPHGPRERTSYAREHAAIFMPIYRLFALVREIGTAVSHEVGAFG